MEAPKSRLARGYSRSAPFYDKMAGHMYLAGFRRLLPYLQVPPMPAILDVGSGTGINLSEAARRFAPTGLLCGIDISPGMVQVARAKAALLGIPAQFTLGDAENLPYQSGLFDLVICNSVLHWFRDRAAALREMSRVLRPGGQLVLICAAVPGFSEWFGLMDDLVRSVLNAAPHRTLPPLPSVPEVAQLLWEAGFTISGLANPIDVQRVTNPELFIRLMSTVAPHWAADLTPFEQEAMEKLSAMVIRKNWPAGFPNTWSAIEAIAVKTP